MFSRSYFNRICHCCGATTATAAGTAGFFMPPCIKRDISYNRYCKIIFCCAGFILEPTSKAIATLGRSYRYCNCSICVNFLIFYYRTTLRIKCYPICNRSIPMIFADCANALFIKIMCCHIFLFITAFAHIPMIFGVLTQSICPIMSQRCISGCKGFACANCATGTAFIVNCIMCAISSLL